MAYVTKWSTEGNNATTGLVQSTTRVSPFYFTAILQDKLKKFESIITSQQVQIQNTEEMLSFNKVRKKINSRVAWSPLKKAERN